MLSIKQFSMLMTIGFVLSVFVTNVMGESLIKYSEDKDGTVMYYDKDSIKRESGIVKVWTKDKFSRKNERWSKWVKLCKENKNIYETESINDCDRFSYRKKLFEINCKKNASRIISSTMYDENGDYLSYIDTPTDPWDFIVSGSIEDELKNSVCK